MLPEPFLGRFGRFCLGNGVVLAHSGAYTLLVVALALTECLERAEPEGYARLFLDEGEPVKLLLARWRVGAGAGAARDYAAGLLAHFDVSSPGMRPEQAGILPSGSLVEPLTRRELEVRQLIALGMTNQAIARQLIVASDTVKAHTSGIYRKLDVANRTETVARARQIGLLP